MIGREPELLAGIVSNLRPCFASLGLDFWTLADEAGIARECLEQPDKFVSLAGFCVMLEKASDQCGDPCFGLHCAEAYPMGAVSTVGYLIMNAPTTHEALQALNRYLRLVVSPVVTSCREENGLLYWTRSFPSRFRVRRLQFDLFSTALVIRRLRQGAGPAWHPEAVEFDHSDPGCTAACARLLAPRVLYDQRQITLILNASMLKRNSKGADPRLFDILSRHAEMLLLERPDPADVVALTRYHIEVMLRGETADLESVAGELKLSPRTLRARLKKAGTTFSSILDHVRAEKTRHYLSETSMQVSEVAFLMGFSELSAFTRAATRWLGKSPTAYRLEVRGGRRVKDDYSI